MRFNKPPPQKMRINLKVALQNSNKFNIEITRTKLKMMFKYKMRIIYMR